MEAVEPKGPSVRYPGCNGYVLRTAETTVYLDSYFGDGEPPRTIRVIPVPWTPEVATQTPCWPLTGTSTTCIRPRTRRWSTVSGATCTRPKLPDAPKYDGDVSVADEDAKVTVEPGDEYEVGELTVHARGANALDAEEPVTYVVEHDAGTFFAGGDTRPWDGFEDVADEFDLDLGVRPCGTTGKVLHTGDDPAETRVTEWYTTATSSRRRWGSSNSVGSFRSTGTCGGTWGRPEEPPRGPRLLRVPPAAGGRPDRRLPGVGRPGVIRPKDIREGEREE